MAQCAVPGVTCRAIYDAIGKWIMDYSIIPTEFRKLSGKHGRMGELQFSTLTRTA
jgi:hypothetical protein